VKIKDVFILEEAVGDLKIEILHGLPIK